MNAGMLLAQIWLVVVSGLGGEPRYSAQFEEQARTLLAVATERFGIPPERTVHLSEFTSPKTSAAAIGDALRGVAARAEPHATVVVLLIGHGSAVGGEARFHLPGPDLTASALAALLAGFPTQRLVAINAASASGPWIEALAAPGRTVITATRSAVERDETVFPRYFIEALGNDAADADKNGRVSVLEAFTYATREVERHYDAARRLRTEHALLDDDGDGRGALLPAADGETDGAHAATVYLDPGFAAADAAAGDPALADLLVRRDSLERALADLRTRRATLPEDEYAARLERLLVELARVGRAIRARAEGTEP